jgi:phosphatidylserine decarboxylase
MRLAKGSTSWLIAPAIGTILSFICILRTETIIQSIFLLLTLLLFLLFIFFLIFFRDPSRTIGEGIVAVADGRIRSIHYKQDDDCGSSVVISTFMNVYNVHVNRCPFDGTIRSITHKKGSHLPAFTKESERNERVIIILETTVGLLKIIQIAGTLARRIVPYVKKGDQLKKGDKIGIIRLGSRVDIVLPESMMNSITIKPNQMVKAGDDTIVTIHD